ncbi:uncharacterized protein LOC113357989 isoform X1 [Papaver somniferum]|uniref:uncharacterized protein LOC113357989 isoform X1 n=1 Tax=Papaver somniferum TaxID=3469 RepID=UPI000E6FEDCB|nr:uncharacterized protein LOC113357989 isoform X1 [Papaver somniferum]XP_026457273.1 uncharacterized protein LOC113357989 isoform X1 [Papaver somniferum]
MQKLHLTTAKLKFRLAHNEKRAFLWSTTSITALDAYFVSIIPQKFCFTEFEDIESTLQNIHLTDVVGFLKTVTNIQVLQRSGGQSSRMREITIENLRGTTMKIARWGSAANQVGNDPIDCDSIPHPVLVVVCSTFVKNYQGESPYLRPMPPESTRMQTYPKSLKCEKGAPMLDHPALSQYRLRKENYLYISILTTGKQYRSFSLPNGILLARPLMSVLICNATATHVLIENGWHYLACHRCSKKVMGDDGDLWCTKCEAKVEIHIARFMVCFEVEDHTGTTVFVALDSEV